MSSVSREIDNRSDASSGEQPTRLSLLSVTDGTSAIESKMRSLEKQYKVTFAKPGEDVDHVEIRSADCKRSEGDMVHATLPSMNELIGLEAALKRSRPSQLTDDGKEGVKIYVLEKPLAELKGRSIKAQFVASDKDGKRAMYIFPAADELPPTSHDPGAESQASLQWVITHEFAHNSASNMWESSKQPPLNYANQIGWKGQTIELPDGKLAKSYILETKDGKYYDFISKGCGDIPRWYNTNAAEQPLNANGKPVDSLDDAAHVTIRQMSDLARVKPITFYFPTPAEMTAESVAAFRGGREMRAKLLHESPTLYRAIKDYDNRELARFHGADSHGRSTHIRTPEGFVVRREPATEKSIMLFEQADKR